MWFRRQHAPAFYRNLRKGSLVNLQRSWYYGGGTWDWKLEKFNLRSFRYCSLLWIGGHHYLSYRNINGDSLDENSPHRVNLRSLFNPWGSFLKWLIAFLQGWGFLGWLCSLPGGWEAQVHIVPEEGIRSYLMGKLGTWACLGWIVPRVASASLVWVLLLCRLCWEALLNVVLDCSNAGDRTSLGAPDLARRLSLLCLLCFRFLISILVSILSMLGASLLAF